MSAPTISVIVPTYRRPALLRRALRSITSQVVEGIDLTVVVCDNASGDETEAVVRGVQRDGASVNYVRRPENIGAVRNFVRAIGDVRADFFCILSDDDVLLPGAIARNFKDLSAHPEAAAWNGYVISASERKFVSVRPAPQWPLGLTRPAQALDLISRNIRPETTGMLFRCDVLTPEDLPEDDQFMAMDVLWVCAAALRGGIGLSGHASAVLFAHEDSASSARDVRRTVSVLFPSIPKLCDAIGAWPIEDSARTRLVTQFQRAYGEHGLMLLLYRAALDGDHDGINAVEQVAGEHPWLASVRAAVPWARRASPVALRAAILLRQFMYGNRKQKLAAIGWRWRYRRQYRHYLQQ